MNTKLRPQIIRGWIYGIIAVSIYDLSRIPFMALGWGDFIPTIGDWIIGADDVHPLIGYGWRYIGNGGGLGITFILLTHMFNLGKTKILTAVLYGLGVWFALDLVLVYSESAQNLMFKLTTLNVIGSFTGHVVFGLVLGVLWKTHPSLGMADDRTTEADLVQKAG